MSRVVTHDLGQTGGPALKTSNRRLENFAFFEYNGQVTIGLAHPAATDFAGYNRTGANDLLAQWTPALPAVLVMSRCDALVPADHTTAAAAAAPPA
jgi:hypothetical protein